MRLRSLSLLLFFIFGYIYIMLNLIGNFLRKFYSKKKEYYSKWHPPISTEMQRLGLTWAYITDPNGPASNGRWIEVCDFCGGNCGQCGMTGRIGNIPFDMERMIKKTLGEL